MRKISISLDEELYERAKAVADAEDMSLSAWLSRAAAEAADIASKQEAMREFVATYGEATPEDKQQAYDELKAAGFFDPPSPEREAARLAALARLRYGPLPDEEVSAGDDITPGLGDEADHDAYDDVVERRAG